MFFSNQIQLAYKSTFSDGTKIRHSIAWECYYCCNYYGRKETFDRNIENFIGQTGIIYNFNIQNLVTYEDNLRYKGNMLLVIYIDF